jgi:predicted lipoprotein with Yx(FWY)xxD motif
MTRSRSMTTLAGAAVIPLAALAAGCGGGNHSATAASSSPPPKTTSAPATTAGVATVHVAKTRLGKILVDSHGHTLYLFKKDKGKKSACSGACAQFWPPLRTSGKPKAGSGAKASLLGTTKRSDGKPQVTYNGHPVYGFVMDKKAGDTNGEGVTAFGAKWFALSASGKQVSPKTAKPAARKSAPAAPKPATTPAAPKPAPPAPKPAPKPAPHAAAPPTPKPAQPSTGGIPQNGGGDGDSDNNGGPSDGDGNV